MLSKVPEGWEMKKLGEVAIVKGGKRMPKGAQFAEEPTPFPYLRVSDFVDGTVATRDVKYILSQHQAQISRYTISKDDLYISIAGTLGVVGLVPPELDGAQLTENAAKISIQDESQIKREYLAFILQSNIGKSQIEAKKRIGGGVPKLALFRIDEIALPIPPLNEQQRIAEILSSVDASIQATQAVIEQAGVVKRGLMENLLTGGLGSKRIEHGKVPEDWESKTVVDVCKILDKHRIPLNADERKARQGNIPYWGANGIFDYVDEAIFDESLLLMPEDGGPFSEAATKPICHKIDEPVWVNNHVHVLRVASADREYVYQWFVHRDITDYLVGGTRAKLNQSALKKLPILIPPLAEQKRIAEILSSVDASIQATQAVIEQAGVVKRGLMEDLLTGKVRTV